MKKITLASLILSLLLALTALSVGAVSEEFSGENRPEIVVVAYGTDESLESVYHTSFHFSVSAIVSYDSLLGRYVMGDIYGARPTVICTEGYMAVTEVPSIRMIDGGRTAVLSAPVTLQNDTGAKTQLVSTMYLYVCSDGGLSLKGY